MNQPLNRRTFLFGALGAGIVIPRAGFAKRISPNERLNVGLIGTANQARFSMDNVRSENIVAMCDIDDKYLTRASLEIPDAKTYNDWRKLLEQKDIEAVVVAVPDHTHAPATLAALQSGRHVYCEKPLTHTVEEARKVAQMAKKMKKATQMGTQIHASDNYRRVVEVIQSGAIGPVREVHTWVGKVWSGTGRPTETPPVPNNIHWDLWLGTSPERPYHPGYLPANWRGWWDWGGGTLADMACHHMDLPFWALDLRYPTHVEATGSPYDKEITAQFITATFEFPARGKQPPVKVHWYDGGKRPPHFAEGKLPNWGDGNLFVGDKGMLLADYSNYRLLPEKDFTGFVPPTPTIANSIGHHAEWIKACKEGTPTTCNFDYSGALTETVLLGAVAFKAGKRLEWDGPKLRIKNDREANALLRKVYRTGWELPG